MEVSIGTDIVAVERIASLVEGPSGERFVQRWFTAQEIAYCQAKAHPSLHLAARVAAKEAVAKSLRSAWPDTPPWKDIEVVVDGDGVPIVHLTGEVRELAGRQGATSIQVSLSHCQEYATATAICLHGAASA